MNKRENDFNLMGPILALDLGEKLVGAAVSDEKLITIKRLPPLNRSNWKKLLRDVLDLIERFDAKTIVMGLPLSLDGTRGDAAENAQRVAQNLARSVSLPVYLQDERLTSFEATENLRGEGKRPDEIPGLVDGEAAAVILRDFLRTDQDRLLVNPQRTRTRLRK
ncbi:MAG TPA: Holliday junction resolvase RuvX [Pyrinomonadaceae bacterium]|nr:Holliday junction resolvase RuvX [Pyrinomonadaceae bacterium]